MPSSRERLHDARRATAVPTLVAAVAPLGAVAWLAAGAAVALLAALLPIGPGISGSAEGLPLRSGSGARVDQVPAETWLPAIVGQEGGDVNGVAGRGGQALVGVGPRLLVLDVAEPAGPRGIWRSEILSAVVAGTAVEGDFGYAVYGHDLLVVDLGDPGAPTVVGQLFLQSADTARGVVVHAGYAYVLLDSLSPQGVAIVDVRDPSRPRRVSTDGWFLVNARDLAVADGHAYVAPDLRILDIGDPEHPRVLASVELPETALTVAAAGNRAYACARSALYAVDVADPTAPEILGTIALDGGGPVAADGGRVYVAGRGGVLTVVDVSDPRRMALLETVPLGASAADVDVVDGRVLVAIPGVGLRIFEADPDAPLVPLEGLDAWSGGADIRVDGGVAVVAAGESGLALVDVSDAVRPRTLGVVGTGAARRVALDASTAFVATAGDGVAVVSVADAAFPTLLGRIPADDADLAIAAGEGSLFIFEPNAGRVRSFDVSDPTAPGELDVMSAPGWGPSDAIVRSGWLFVGDRDAGLRVLDARDPSRLRPTALVTYTTPTYSRGLALLDDRLYAVRGDPGGGRGASAGYAPPPDGAAPAASARRVSCPPPPPPDDRIVEIDVAVPETPRLLRDLGPAGWPQGVAVAEGRVFVPSSLGRYYGDSLFVLSREGGQGVEIALPARPSGVAAVGRHAYVITSDGGLLAIEMVQQAPTATVPPVHTPTSPPTVPASATPPRQSSAVLPFAAKGTRTVMLTSPAVVVVREGEAVRYPGGNSDR